MATENNFNFLNYRVTKLNFSLNKDFLDNPESQNIELSPNINLSYTKRDGNAVSVDLSIKFKGSKIPFLLEAVLTGFFQFNYDVEDKDLHKLAHINLAAILFPFLRQTVADMTTKAGFPPLLLPPINFVKSYEEIKKNLQISD